MNSILNMDFHCLTRCRSALTCATFGYCRERNFDGKPVNRAENERRKEESDADWSVANGQFGVGA